MATSVWVAFYAARDNGAIIGSYAGRLRASGRDSAKAAAEFATRPGFVLVALRPADMLDRQPWLD